MSTIRLQDAIGEIRNCYIEEAHAEPSHRPTHATSHALTPGRARVPSEMGLRVTDV